MTIDKFNFSGKKAIVRVDFNVPLDENGKITDDTRIRGALPTLKKVLALDAGVLLLGHLVKGESIILNEKEVMCLPSLDGELEDRILLLDGIVYTNTSMNQIISEGGWEYGRKL